MKIDDILKISFPVKVLYTSGEVDLVYGLCLMDDYIFTQEGGEFSGYVRDVKKWELL